MSTIFSGQLFLIDSNFERALIFKKKLKDVNDTIFFTYYPSVKEAFKMFSNKEVIAPEFVYVHASLVNAEAKDTLKKLRMINKSKHTKIVVFGNEITDAIITASVTYNFQIIKTYPESDKAHCNLFNGGSITPHYNVDGTLDRKCC